MAQHNHADLRDRLAAGHVFETLPEDGSHRGPVMPVYRGQRPSWRAAVGCESGGCHG